uniref:Helicase HerA central domain-containing protein n=1 Tax=Thermosporothrix sp. COM3 TaxID=2490863 RepID=A0A455SGB8_9CHLR|nr:hypothetical protein KTC_22480 [Thermosporothrix sp. COM3]
MMLEPQQNEAVLALLVIPPSRLKKEQVALEAAMQSLVLDKKHPLSLELAGTAERRSFILRATTRTALDHAEAVLRSQYPQMEVRPLYPHEDPFVLEPYEAVTAVELVTGGQTYMPLRTWQQEQERQEDLDPLQGLLAALSRLPEHTRVISQLALVPAPPAWSRRDARKAIESPLDKERRAMQIEMAEMRLNREAVISTPIIIALGLLLLLFLAMRPLIPGWTWDMLTDLLLGRVPQLSSEQVLQLILLIGGIFCAILLFWGVGAFIQSKLKERRAYDTRMVAQRVSRMAYKARLRLYVIGPKQASYLDDGGLLKRLQERWKETRERKDMLLRLIAAYRQFDRANGAYFQPKRIRRPGRLFQRWHRDVARSQHLLTVDALATLWHLPQADALPELSLVEHRRARTMLLPPDLARQVAHLRPVGYSEHGGYRLPFGLDSTFFTQHTLIAGKSGEGKSTFMEHIAHDAMKLGGLMVIDPHGDLCEHILHIVPEYRAEDVVFIDLSDPDAAVGLNPLDVTLGRGRDKAISDLLKTLAHIWATSWGPRMENAFEMSLRTLFEANRVLVARDPLEGPRQQYTLLDVLPILTNENFCHAILQQIDDDYLHRWWREYYEPLTLMQQREVINPVITKVAKFESVIARRIIGQPVSTINFTQMIEERKIILFKLAKGVVGADVAALLGASMLGLFQITLEEQGIKQEIERVRYPIILDEFQTLAGVDYGALAELRKYGATFFLATQSLEYLQNLDPLLLPTVLANVKQLVIFNLSAQDAETMYRELGVERDDILNLDMHTCYVRLSALQKRQPTFSLKVTPLDIRNVEQAESIRTRSRVRYASSVGLVDEMLREAMVRGIRMAPVQPEKKKKKARQPSEPARQPEAVESPVILLPPATEPVTEPVAEDMEPQEEAAVEKKRKRRKRGKGGKKKAEALVAAGEEEESPSEEGA